MMLLNYFRVFGWIFGKRDKNQQLWVTFRVLCHGVGIPCSNVGPHQGVASPCRGVAEREV